VSSYYTKFTGELTRAVDDLELVMPVAVANPGPNGTNVEIEIWKNDCRNFRERTQAYNDFKAGLCNVVLGQCTDPVMSAQMQTLTLHKQMVLLC
jgi:hypothetical protein